MLRHSALLVSCALFAACVSVPPDDSAGGCGGSSSATMPSTSTSSASTAQAGCTSIADCGGLAAGPCGTVACDESGLVGVPQVPGVPAGCYVRIAPVCETPANIGGPCVANSDCLALKCYATACVKGTCESPLLPANTPCGAAGAVCDGAGHCKGG